jgi:predicted RNA-binding Zn ribbon-like protein
MPLLVQVYPIYSHQSRGEYWCSGKRDSGDAVRQPGRRSTITAELLSFDVPFRFVAGTAALDLVNTVDWAGAGLKEERLSDYGRLTEWACGAGVLSQQDAARLRRGAESKPREAEATHRAAVRIRGVLQRLFSAVAQGRPDRVALDDFNRWLGRALKPMEVIRPQRTRSAGDRFQWEWKDREKRLDSVLWPVLWSAASLLTSDEVSRVRVCGGPDCGWMYVDRSRNGLRRWCQMETCGTKEKSRRRRVGR